MNKDRKLLTLEDLQQYNREFVTQGVVIRETSIYSSSGTIGLISYIIHAWKTDPYTLNEAIGVEDIFSFCGGRTVGECLEIINQITLLGIDLTRFQDIE